MPDALEGAESKLLAVVSQDASPWTAKRVFSPMAVHGAMLS